VQAVVVVIALFYARHQLSEAARSRELNATTQLLKEIGAPEIRKARGYVLFELSPSFDVSKLKKDEIDMIGSLAVAYDRVGYMINEKLLPPKAVFEFHGDDIELVWKKIEPFVRYYQEQADPRRPNYCKHFELLVTKSLPEMKREYGDTKRPVAAQADKL
jgi:hypothetical protein